MSEAVAIGARDDESRRATPAIQLVRLRKNFGDVVAVDDIDLEIAEGEFFSLLGPSGSGKTTVLRMIAGFELPTGGAVLLQGNDVSQLAPYDRDVNTVFQDYALFPHMSVLENIEYGLKVKKIGKADRRRRASEMLEAVRLADYGERRPNQLSGGQRQRIALARALVNHPKVLLLDEPLGALDLKLREEMQVELKSIQRDVGITFVFVTHDQGEALSMSNRIAVFNQGRIEQVGTPREIYDHPATALRRRVRRHVERAHRRAFAAAARRRRAALDPSRAAADRPARDRRHRDLGGRCRQRHPISRCRLSSASATRRRHLHDRQRAQRRACWCCHRRQSSAWHGRGTRPFPSPIQTSPKGETHEISTVSRRRGSGHAARVGLRK